MCPVFSVSSWADIFNAEFTESTDYISWSWPGKSFLVLSDSLSLSSGISLHNVKYDYPVLIYTFSETYTANMILKNRATP